MGTRYTWNPERRRMDFEREGDKVEIFHVRSPQTGAIHDVPDDHAAVLALKAMEAGFGNGDGWRWATPEETSAMYDVHGVPEEERPRQRKRKVDEEMPEPVRPSTSTGSARSSRA